MSWKRVKSSPLFIGGHRKCGTTLFVSLLDGHEELFIFPSESGFFYKFYPIFEDLKYSYEDRVNRMIDSILRTLEEVVAEWIGYDNCPSFSLDRLAAVFREKLEASPKQTKDFLEAMIYAAWEVLPGPKERQKYWVDKTTSTEIYAPLLFQWYPEAKFIHVLRDPRDNYGAIKAGWEKRYQYQFDCKERLLQSVIDRAKLGMELAEINQRRFGTKRYLVIRYEDVATQAEATLRRVCEFLEIPFQPSLLVPTFCGQVWGGNNHELKKFSSVSQGSVNRWRERIDEHEAKVIEYYFRDVMPRQGYVPTYDLQEAADAAREHYKWFNYAQVYSLKVNEYYPLTHMKGPGAPR
jgi:hypothetical protein